MTGLVRLSPGRTRLLVRLLPLAAMAVALLALAVGSRFTPLVTMCFVWFAMPITFLPRRTAIAVMAWAAAVNGALLALQTGNPEPFVPWEITVGIMIITALATNRLVERASALTADERAARADAERAQVELERVSADKTRFLARMSHELRTPLNAIIGFSDVLARRNYGELTAKQAEYVDDVVESGRHLLSLVDDVLDLAKVETGTVELDVAPVPLSDLLAAVLGLFKEQAGRRRIALSLNLSPDLPVIEADGRKLKQVVFNLLANAVRFTPPDGRVVLGATPSPDHVLFWVSDTGPGIAASDREAIFEEFRQGPPAGERSGTGLGLPVARRLVELHGGRLWVDSEVGAGSTFTVQLPRRPVGRPAGVVQEPKPPGRVRFVLGEPDSPERRAENARLLVLLGIGSLVMGLLCLVVLHFHPPARPVVFEEGPLILAITVCACLMVLAVLRPETLGSPVAACGLAMFGIVYLSVCMTNVGPAIGDVPIMYVVTVAGIFMLLSPAQMGLQLATLAVSYAVVLRVEGYDLPVVRWLVTVGFVTVTAVILRQFMRRVTALFAAERDARAEAERAAIALAEASHHKTAFLANMSHELRTPLNVIIGFSEVLESEAFGPLNPKQAEYVRDVLSSGRHLLALINDILALAKIDAGRMDLWLTEVDVDASVATALAPFRPEALRRDIEIEVDLLAGDGVVADESKFVAAVGHLVSNALKFTPDGGRVTVRTTRSPHETTVSVTDTGQGIEPGDHQRIFDAFALGDTQSDQGTGLGLALARRYTELHSGALEVTSAVGQGSTFTLRMPLRPATASAEVPA